MRFLLLSLVASLYVDAFLKTLSPIVNTRRVLCQNKATIEFKKALLHLGQRLFINEFVNEYSSSEVLGVYLVSDKNETVNYVGISRYVLRFLHFSC